MLVLLDANPLDTLRARPQIDKIILHADVIERESLAADVPREREARRLRLLAG